MTDSTADEAPDRGWLWLVLVSVMVIGVLITLALLR
jgi:hypothetical protein